jgi:hypothetical protein
VEAAPVAKSDVTRWRALAATAAITAAMGMLALRGFAVVGMPAGLPLVALGLLAAGGWLVGAGAVRPAR